MKMRLKSKQAFIFAICLLIVILVVSNRISNNNNNSNDNESNNRNHNNDNNNNNNDDDNSLEAVRPQLQSTNGSVFKEGDEKVILLYSTWFNQQQWGAFNGDLLRSEFTQCRKSKNCIATYNKSLINVADVVLFHGRDVEENKNYRANILQDLRKTVPVKQKWIFLSHETPQRDANLYKPYDGIFNWTATFSRDSDVFIPYKGYFKFDQPKEETKVNYAEGKTRLVSWAVSNCLETSQNFALELQRYIHLTVYGNCGENFKNHRECKRQEQAAVNVGSCAKEMASYKFYLAFENAFCHDWVSEKYWRTVTENIVPVVMGANYDEGAAIPGSFIDVNDFNSIKELADYLLFLDKNDDEYNKYFAWKTKYGLARGNFYCTICHELNSDKFRKKSQVVLSEAYSVTNDCLRYTYREEKIRRMTEKSRIN